MQMIFRYDLDRLLSYAHRVPGEITVASEPAFMMMSFDNVNYFNYTFGLSEEPYTHAHQKLIEDFYNTRYIHKHRVIVDADCPYSNAVFKQHGGYTHTNTIVQTVFDGANTCRPALRSDVQLVPANEELMPVFTELFLQGFHAHGRDSEEVSYNLTNMLYVNGMRLFLVKAGDDYVGINVLYENETESLIAEGAIAPGYRNRGYHKGSLACRIDLVLQNRPSQKIIAWAYKNSISLHNMYKTGMKTQQEFNVYEYCR